MLVSRQGRVREKCFCERLETVIIHTLILGSTAASKLHGSYHWSYERILSIATIPLIASAFTMTHPHIDFALGIVLPLHCHLGMDCIITDYLPKRRVGVIHPIAKTTLGLTTLLSLYGLYKLNTEDVGITEYVKKVWKN